MCKRNGHRLDPIFSVCNWWHVWFLISAGDVPLMRVSPPLADRSMWNRLRVLFFDTHTPLTSQTICSLFKQVLCFKFHHSCTNTHAQAVVPVLTNLHPVWRWVTGGFNDAGCTSSMCDTSPRLRVLLTSCQSWRWVRLCIQQHVHYMKVNIQPLSCPVVSVPWWDYFHCHFQAELTHKFTFPTSVFFSC